MSQLVLLILFSASVIYDISLWVETLSYGISDVCSLLSELTSFVQVNGVQDLRVSLPTSRVHQQDQTVSYQPVTVTEPPPPPPPLLATATCPGLPSSAAPPPPGFSLSLVAEGQQSSFSVVSTPPLTSSAALNVPMIGQQQSENGASSGGGPIRRRVSDKTALPLSSGNVYYM